MAGRILLVDEESKADEDDGRENFAKAAALVVALDDDALAQERVELRHCSVFVAGRHLLPLLFKLAISDFKRWNGYKVCRLSCHWC